MSTPNRTRGERILDLAGQRVLLVPSFDALCKIEAATGKTLVELATLAVAGALGLKDTTATVLELVKAGPDPLARGARAETIGTLVLQHGLPKLQPGLAAVLVEALRGGMPAEDGEDAAAGKAAAATAKGVQPAAGTIIPASSASPPPA